MDDIVEDALETLLRSPPTAASPKDPSTQLSRADLLRFLALDCTRAAMARVCETKRLSPFSLLFLRAVLSSALADITDDITVYRYAPEKALDTLRAKVARLNTAAVFEGSRTLVRALATDGLMDDGKDELLERAFCALPTSNATLSAL